MKKLIVLVFIAAVAGGYVYWNQGADDVLVVEEEVSIVGIWISDDDSLATAVFSDDGTYQYAYDGELMNSGDWEVDGDQLTEYSEIGDLEFVILELDADTLVLSYTARGNTLRYSRFAD